jgi:transposase
VPEIWLPDPRVRRERELARFRLHLVKHRSMLKHRIHSTLINFGQPCPVSDLFGRAGRELLGRLELPAAWRQSLDPSLHLIDELELQLELQLAEIQKQLRAAHPDHPYAAAAADRARDRLGPRLHDRRRDRRHQTLPVGDQAPGLHRALPEGRPVGQLRPPRPALQARSEVPALALVEATMHALRHPAYAERYQRAKRRHGKPRGAEVAQVEIARRPTRAIWHMLTYSQPFKAQAPGGAAVRLAA